MTDVQIFFKKPNDEDAVILHSNISETGIELRRKFKLSQTWDKSTVHFIAGISFKNSVTSLLIKPSYIETRNIKINEINHDKID